MNKKVSISLLALLLFTQVSPIALSAEQILNENTTSEAVSTVENTDTEATSIDTTEQNSSEAVVAEETTTEDVVTEETTTEDVVTEETTTEDVATEETTTEDVATEESTTEDVATEETTTEEVATVETTTEDVATEETTTEDVATEETTTEDVATEETTTEDVATEETATEDVATEETTTEDVATEETTSDDAITFELTEATTASDEVGVSVQRAIVNNTGSSEVVDLSKNTTATKDNANAGKYELKFDVDSLTLVDKEEESTKSTDINTRQVKSEVENIQNDVQLSAVNTDEDINSLLANIKGDQFLVGADGEILAADETNFITIGGTNYISYIYDSLENVGNQEAGLPLHGGAQTGKYIETVYSNGEYFAHVEIGGAEGYMYLDDIQILPGEFELAENYYENVDGNWTKFVPVDALQSNEYDTYEVGSAPEWAVEGKKYYSNDNTNYYENTISNSRDSKVVATGVSYYQNLPFRSTSDVTAQQLKSYLAAKGFTSSAYYNSTNAFIKAQEVYGVNALFLFAEANLESAYGTSTWATTCYNFFGRAANDGQEYNACVYPMGWPTAYDAILAQAVFLSNSYADVNSSLYFGTHPGDKISGINARYASDVDYGAKIGSRMYDVDKYAGLNEEGKYRIASMDVQAPSYTTSSLSTIVKEMGSFTDAYQSWDPTNTSNTATYYQEQRVNTWWNQSQISRPRIIITDETSNAIEYQIDQPLALSTGWYPFSAGEYGYYPYFNDNKTYYPFGGDGQAYANYLLKGTSNSNARYNNEWTSQQVWYPKEYNNYSTYSLINDVPAVSPGIETKPEVETKTTCTYYSNGYVKECRKYEDDVLVSIYNYYPNTVDSDKGNHIKYRFDVNKDGTIKQATKYSDVKKQRLAIYQYYSGTKYGSHTNHIKFRFDLNTDGTIKSASRYTNNAQVKDKVYTYYSGTKYSTTGLHANHMKNSFDLNSSGGVTKAQAYTNNTHYLSTIYTYYGTPKYGTHGSHIKSRYYINTSGYLYKATTSKDNNGYTQYIYTYYPYTKYGTDHGNHIKNRFDNNSSEYLTNAYLYADGTHNLLKKYWYDPYTRYGSHGDHISKVYVY